MERSEHAPELQYLWLVPTLLLCLLPLCFLGYGSDNDTYGMLEFGEQTWRTHVLATSRDPGYWTYEAVVFVLASLGGWILSNLASLAVTAVVAWRFLNIAARLRVSHPVILSACLLLTPVVAIAATSTIDYMWSLLCIVLATELLFDERLVPAAPPCRASNQLSSERTPWSWRAVMRPRLGLQSIGIDVLTSAALKLTASGLAAAVLGCSTYVLSYRWAHNTMAFLKPEVGPPEMWTWKGYLGRFVYKGLYALGPVAMLVCAYAFARWLRGDGTSRVPETAKPMAICAGFLAGNLLLFLKFPVEISYLIPAVFFFLLLAGATFLQQSRGVCLVLLASIVTLNVVTPVFAAPDRPGLATSGHLHLAVAPGTLTDDIHFRRMVMGCKYVACWVEHSKLGHH